MPYDGLGTFTRVYDWEDDRTNNIKINATRMDNEMDGFSTAFNLCFLRDGRVAMQAALPMGANRITGLATGAAATPSIAFSAATTSGIWNAGSGALGYSYQGTNALTVNDKSVDGASMVRALGLTLPTTGAGIELGYAANIGYLGVIDRATSTYKELQLRGSTIKMAPSGTVCLTYDGTTLTINPSGGATVLSLTAAGIAITGTATIGGSAIVHVGSTNALPLAGLVNQAQQTIAGRADGAGTGALTALTAAQVRAIIAAVSGSSTAFLNGAGNFTTPAGGAVRQAELAATFSDSDTTITTITGFTVSVPAGKTYRVKAAGVYSQSGVAGFMKLETAVGGTTAHATSDPVSIVSRIGHNAGVDEAYTGGTSNGTTITQTNTGSSAITAGNKYFWDVEVHVRNFHATDATTVTIGVTGTAFGTQIDILAGSHMGYENIA